MNEFHGVEFWKPDGGRRGVYARWPDSKADQFIGDLLACIGGHKIYPCGATLKIDAWMNLNKNERMFLTGGRYEPSGQKWITPSAPNQTYYLPFQFALSTPAIRCKAGFKVHYVFDLNKQFKTHATTMYELLKKDKTFSKRDRLGKFAMENGQDAPGLQAADLLAYQLYQFNRKRVLQTIPMALSQIPEILRAAIKNAKDPVDFPFFDEEGLDVALEPLPTSLRSAVTIQSP